MYSSPTISDYYRAAVEQLKQEVESTPDDRVLGMDLDQWVDYVVNKYSMEPIQLDDARSTELFEVEVEHTLRGYDIMSDRGPGSVVRTTKRESNSAGRPFRHIARDLETRTRA